jgi:hypothetical protein
MFCATRSFSTVRREDGRMFQETETARRMVAAMASQRQGRLLAAGLASFAAACRKALRRERSNCAGAA